MEQQQRNQAYADIMVESLKQKVLILDEIIRITKEQAQILAKNKLELEDFQETLTKKERVIKALERLDTGFDTNYRRLQSEFAVHKELYQKEILAMKQYIAKITDQSMEIQYLEKQNKIVLENHLKTQRNDIRTFKVNNRMAQSYYNNMNRQVAEASYFLDKKR